ncbi:MAG: beta-propeller fold lactonase family protein [Bacteroidales bacterium]|nr:beta-propeller fold lactonase family protein [Bacteroidales bacterium]MCF8403525.1 beta-propeller fold lactonase family protein [Bacteroidales bacterium]
MIRKFYTLAIGYLLFIPALIAQEIIPQTDENSLPEIQKVIVEKGQTLLDFIDPILFSETQTDIDPGVPPEGDFMLRSSFTPDGSKVFVCTGGTDNVTVYDYTSMQALTVIEVGNYPCDVAINDQYAVIPCIFGDEIYVIDISDYSLAAIFTTPVGAQPAVVELSPDGNYAYVACDINDQCEVIDLQNLTQLAPLTNFPIALLSFSWVSTGGRSSFKFTRFNVSSDGDHLIVGDSENDVLFIDPTTGNIDFTVNNIPNCFVTGLSGDGSKTIALSDENNLFQVFQIDNTTHTISASVDITGNYLACYDVAVNQDGSKAFIGIGNNSSAIVRFATSDFIVFTQTYTPFWMGTTYDHQYAISGQYRFSVMDFENENMIDQLQGYSQDFGCISPVEYLAVGYDPLRYEGAYFYEFTNPGDIQFNGKALAGLPPEADTPYRIAISPDGSKAITSNSLSESMTIINLATYAVDTVIDLGEKCDAIGITHDSHWGIMGGYDLNTIKIIDLLSNEFVASVYTGQRPLMVDISPDDQFAYIGNLKGNSVSFVELDGAASNEIIEIPTGVIGLSWAAFGVRSSVELDPTGQFVLVAVSFEDKVQVIDVSQQLIVANLPVGTFPLKIAFNSTGEYAAVTNYNSDNYSIIHVDGANSSVVGTFPCNGDGPLRLAYNPVDNEFGIINYSTKTVINVDPETGAINSTDYYTQYGNPIQIAYDAEGNPIVLALSANDDPGYVIRKNEAVVLPATPTYFDFCLETNTAVVCMPGPDYVTVIEYEDITDPPVADFTANVTTIQVGQSVEFSDLSLNNPNSWDWVFEGGDPATSSEPNPEVSYNDIGAFDVSLTVANANGADTKLEEDFIIVDTLTFIGEKEIKLECRIYPNPLENIFFVELDEFPVDEIIVSLFDLKGKLIYSTELQQLVNEIDISKKEAGVYLLKVRYGNQVKTIKIRKT